MSKGTDGARSFDLLTTTEAAARLGFHPDSVLRAVRKGQLLYVRKVGTSYLFDPDVIDAYRELRGRAQKTLPTDGTDRA